MMPRLISWLVPGTPSVNGGLTLLLLVMGAGVASAQVILDGKFGSKGPLSGPNYSIGAGLGLTRGNNLFHSFTRFDLNFGDTATFSGPANIQNILARVTGGSASSIDGTVRSDIAGANLFLINPNGIIFGPNAVVDVSGSFAATSASYLKLADGARFVASLDADDSRLSTAPVSAFGFLGDNPGNITVQQSTLAVQEGKTIALVGGDITMDGASVQAPGGHIDVASVRSAGEVPVDPAALNRAEFKAAFPQQGSITLQNLARLDASADGGGRIVIRGGRLLVENSKIEANTTGAGNGQGIDVAVANDVQLLNGGQINSISVDGIGPGGDISVNAESLRLDGGGLVDENTFFPLTQISTATGNPVGGGGPARGANVVINVNSFELANSALISSTTWGAGDAGRIEINALSIRLDALFTTIATLNAESWGSGKAGEILIGSDTLEMRNGATMFATSAGAGEAGRVDIDARSVNLNSGSIITAATFGSGNGGNVHVNANTIRIDGANNFADGADLLTGIQVITSSLDSPAPGGNIQVTADSVVLRNMGTLFTSSYGIGQGGNIEVNARNVTLARGATIKAEGLDFGPAGNISLRADRNIVLTGRSAVSTSALNSSGGEISAMAGSEIHLLYSKITAQAGPGGGGNITVNAPDLTYLFYGSLSAEAVGDGGNLNLDPQFFILDNSSLISRSSSANGGNITILADYFLQSASLIDASAPFGLPGTVSVTAPDLDLSGVLIGLPGNLLDIENQLRPDCRVRVAGGTSTFIMLGRGGLPLEPGGFVPSGPP